MSFESRYGICDYDSFLRAAITLPSADRDLLMCFASSCCCLLLSPSSFSEPARSTKMKLLTRLLSDSICFYIPWFFWLYALPTASKMSSYFVLAI